MTNQYTRSSVSLELEALESREMLSGTRPPLSIVIGGVTSGQTETREVLVRAAVTGSSPVTHVDFYLDGHLMAKDLSSPYTWTLDPTRYGNGWHTVKVMAYDKAGHAAVNSLSLITHHGSTPPAGNPAGSSTGSRSAFAVAIGGVTSEETLTREALVRAVTSGSNSAVTHVDFYLDGHLMASDTSSPYYWTLDPTRYGNGWHTVKVMAYDRAGEAAVNSLSLITHKATSGGGGSSGSGGSTGSSGGSKGGGSTGSRGGSTGSSGSSGGSKGGPVIPQHLPSIRLADLAYAGTPLSGSMRQLLQKYVDLVIPNTAYLGAIASMAPHTPQLIYTNVASLYQGLLSSWIGYAESHGLNPEQAFYHVARATPFSGSSSSSTPVNWFWAVYQGGGTANFIDYTAAAHTWDSRSLAFGGVGTSVSVGYPYLFREINLNLMSGAGSGWSGVLEYPTAVDAGGNPTAWATLRTLTDTTGGLSRSGQITFDPPANWKPASLGGSPLYYYARIRTVTPGRAPVANTVLGMDYLNTGGGNSGTIPAFDYAAAGGKSYLTAAEYAHRKPGANAWFAYQSQDLTESYGPMRPATNPSAAGLRDWVVQYSLSYLNSNPLAAGLFVDNSSGNLSLTTMDTLEPTNTYSTAYGKLLGALSQAIAPRWVLANISGGNSTADATIQYNAGYFDEFALRPLQNNWIQFDDLAGQLDEWAALRSPAPDAVLDALPAGGLPSDPRTQMAALAEYYLLAADPQRTFLDLWGGYAPATDWSQHFFGALAANIGQPTGTWSLIASGQDPGDRSLNYQVYQRSYSNALVLYKPLSYAGGVTGTTADKTATFLRLNGVYRALQANGTLGAPVTGVWLRNGEGAVLMHA
jgi:hypothetical protein